MEARCVEWRAALMKASGSSSWVVEAWPALRPGEEPPSGKGLKGQSLAWPLTCFEAWGNDQLAILPDKYN